jgi:hypothetical protein
MHMSRSQLANLQEETNVNAVDEFLVPETLQGPYADFYRRAITELLYWRLLREGSDNEADMNLDPVDPLTFDAIGIQFGQA